MELQDMQDITGFDLQITYRICSGVVNIVKTYYAPTVCKAIRQAVEEFPTFISIKIIPDNHEYNEVRAYEVD